MTFLSKGLNALEDLSHDFDLCICPAAGQMLFAPILRETDAGVTVLLAAQTAMNIGQRVRAYYHGDPYEATVQSIEAADGGSQVRLLWARG